MQSLTSAALLFRYRLRTQ